MVTVLYADLEERFPGLEEPDWYPEAISYLRGDVDSGRFGQYLYELIRSRPEIETVVNIGTARGHSTVCAAKALESVGRAGTVHTIDVMEPDEERDWHVEKHPASDPLRGRAVSMRALVERFHDPDSESVPIQFHLGESSEILSSWNHSQPDLVFHDGAHTYSTVRTDIALTTEMGEKTPVQVFDDCYLHRPVWSYRPFTSSRSYELSAFPKLGGIIRRLRQLSLSRIRFPGVTQAVAEAFEGEEWETLEVISDPDHAPITGLFPADPGTESRT